jgi:hypothetical protein
MKKLLTGKVHVQAEIQVGGLTDRARFFGGNILNLSENVFPSASNEIPFHAVWYKIGTHRTDSIS